MNSQPTIEELARSAHAFLFTEGGEMSRKKLALLLSCSADELALALAHLAERLKGSGITLVVGDTEVGLVVSKEESPVLEEALKRELSRDIGEAGLEVLAIVLYMGPSTRARVDYIRGVNSASTLRTLLARGLVERAGNPDDAREYLYRPTIQLLAHLGAEHTKDLPEYATITRELASFEAQNVRAGGPFEDNGPR